MSTKAKKESAQADRNENRSQKESEITQTQAMPADGLKGAPDGVNTQGAAGATGGSDAGDTYPNPPQHASQADKSLSRKSGFKGGQSTRAYHGPRQLGDTEIVPGGNINAGAKE